jgi:hypothetical protein
MRFAAFLAVLLLPAAASAQQMGVIMEGLTGCDFQTGKLLAACIPVFIAHLVTIIMGLVGSIFVINVMIGGYQYAIGALEGDEGKGKERIYWSIIGLVVTSCAYLIIDLVLTVLGI